MRRSMMLFQPSPHLTVEALGTCGPNCGCESCGGGMYGLSSLGDFTETTNAKTGDTSYEYKSGGVDPATGTKVVLESFSDLFTGKREKDAARQSAERLAAIQAQTDAATLQAREIATERWTAVAPWALMAVGVIGVGIILLKVSKS